MPSIASNDVDYCSIFVEIINRERIAKFEKVAESR